MSELRFIVTEDNIQKAIDSIDFRNIRNIVIGYDFRPSSLKVLKLLKESLIKDNITIHAEMPSSTPEMCYLSKYCGNSIMITASHNPVKYNGLKFFVNGMEVESSNFTEGYLFNDWKLHNYLDIYAHKLKDIKVVTCLDYLPRDKVDEFFKKIGIEYIDIEHLIGTEPIYNLNIKEAILKENADYGIFFDTDMDRVMIINNRGKKITPDTIADSIIKNNGFTNTVSTIDSSIKNNKCDIGRLNVINNLKHNNAFFGHEMSDHYYFPINMLCADGMFAFYLCVLYNIQENRFDEPLEIKVYSDKDIHNILLPYEKTFVSRNTVKYKINDREWIIFRRSETERRLIRVITNNINYINSINYIYKLL